MLQPKYVNWLTWCSVSSFIIIFALKWSVPTKPNTFVLLYTFHTHFVHLTFSEPCIVIHICKKNQQNAHFSSLMIQFNYIVFDMFRTSKCPSSGKLYKQLYNILSCWNFNKAVWIWCDFDRASSLICGNKMPTRFNRGFYCRSYCLLNMIRASLCPSSGAQEYYTVVAACGILCCGFFK